jgi:hypothetical protein
MAFAVVLAACGEPPVAGPDASFGRDAMLAEGGIRLDVSEYDGGEHDATVEVDAESPVLCTTGACDPRDPVRSCAGRGVCVLRDRWPVCVMRVGDLPEHAPCMASEECAPGHACFRGPDGGVCARVCCPASDSALCGTDTRCSADGTLSNGVVTSWGRCAPHTACDLFAPERSCAPREGCYIVYPRRETEPETECLYAGSADVGDRCVEQNDCRPGLFCAGIGSRSCVRICRLDEPESCPSDEGRCVAQAYSPRGTGVCVPL